MQGRGVLGAVIAAAVVAAAVMFWPAAPGPTAPQDRPLPPLPADRALRIVALGTSLTAAPGWPEAVEARLSACLAAPPKLQRIARAGANSRWALQQMAPLRAARPDLVLVEFAINDADLRDGLSLAAAADATRALVTSLREAAPGAAIALMTTSPATGPRGWLRPRLASHYRQYRDIAAGMQTALVDLDPRWRSAPEPLRRFPDGLHPPAEAAAAIAAPAIAGMIGAALGRSGC